MQGEKKKKDIILVSISCSHISILIWSSGVVLKKISLVVFTYPVSMV